jgi:hypothetical protein
MCARNAGDAESVPTAFPPPDQASMIRTSALGDLLQQLDVIAGARRRGRPESTGCR